MLHTRVTITREKPKKIFIFGNMIWPLNVRVITRTARIDNECVRQILLEVQHPPYSPELTPYDKVKFELNGKNFTTLKM